MEKKIIACILLLVFHTCHAEIKVECTYKFKISVSDTKALTYTNKPLTPEEQKLMEEEAKKEAEDPDPEVLKDVPSGANPSIPVCTYCVNLKFIQINCELKGKTQENKNEFEKALKEKLGSEDGKTNFYLADDTLGCDGSFVSSEEKGGFHKPSLCEGETALRLTAQSHRDGRQ